MALRRKLVLPSRMSPEAGQAEASPAPKPAPAAEKPQPAPVVETPQPSETQQLAAATSSAFSTLEAEPQAIEPSKPARVLEESFTAPAQAMAARAPEPEPEPIPQPAPLVLPQPAAEFPAADFPAAPLDVPGFGVAEEPAAPAIPAVVEAPVEAPAEPIIAAQPEPEPAPQPEPEPAPQPEPEPVKAAPAPEPARPDTSNQMRRRVREKRPRDFSAAKGAEAAEPEQPKTETNFGAKVPVNTQPLNKVDEELIASGILAAPAADSLTSSMPVGVAESQAPAFAPLPEAAKPAPAVSQPEPAPKPFKPRFESVQEPEPEDEPIAAPAAPAKPQEPAASPFNLAKAPASEPLPPVQSDLPWTTPQLTGDWDIATPETPAWSHDSLPSETIAAAPGQLPPPVDMYRPQTLESTAGSPPWAGGLGASSTPARAASTLPPPELPRHTPRRNGGTPWGVMLVGLLIAGGAAYLAFKPSSGNLQQSLNRLTDSLHGTSDLAAVSGTTPGLQADIGNNGLLPAPSSTLFSGAPLPPVATAAENAAGNTSSSAIVNFADVTPEQARQPIVADGTEKMPADVSLMSKWQQAVAEARDRKDNKGGSTGADVSETAAAVAAADKATAEPFTPAKLQEELDAYRRALAESPNPSSLKPAQFLKDPDGYMDGKPQQAAANASGTTSAAGEPNLLPPPELYTNNPKNLPVVAEPAASAPPRVRTLADFQDAEPFAPAEDRVEIPKGLKPRLAATDFPALEVLSFVPGRGIVAYSDGREGVLLIGEMLNGWELVGVSEDHAEFKAGQKTYQVSADN